MAHHEHRHGNRFLLSGASVLALAGAVGVVGHAKPSFIAGERLFLTPQQLRHAGLNRSGGSYKYRVFYTPISPEEVERRARRSLGSGWEEKIEGDFKKGDSELVVSFMDDQLAQSLNRYPGGSLIALHNPALPVKDTVDDLLDRAGL